MDINRLKKSLIKHEGVRYAPYRDTENNLTIGVGHLIPKDQEQKFLNRKDLNNAEVDAIFMTDLRIAIEDANKFIKEDSIPEEAFEIVVEMAFNLGLPRLLTFVNFRKSLQDQDFIKASLDMKDSKWYRQVKTRGVNLVERMRDV